MINNSENQLGKTMLDAPKKSNKKCAIKGCKSKSGSGIKFHTFPSDLNVRQAWVDACKMTKKITIHDRICSQHFISSDYKTAKSKFLWTFAVPSQNLPLSSTFVDMVGEAADNNSLDMDYDPLEEQNSAPSQLQISILTDIKAEELLDDQEMRTRNIDEKKYLNVCRFCLTEHDPNEMIRIAWDEWQNDPLAKLYKIVTNCNLFVASYCSELCCLVCCNMIYQLSSAIELFQKSDTFWRSQSVPASVKDEMLDDRNYSIGDHDAMGCIEVDFLEETKATDGDDQPDDINEIYNDFIEPTSPESDYFGDNLSPVRSRNERSLDTLTACDCCSKVFADYNLMRRHRKSAHAPDYFQCSECKKLFKTRKGLRQHMVGHAHALFQCGICDQKFSQKRYIILHMNRTHSSIRRHVCYMCGMSFRNYATWKNHEARKCATNLRQAPGIDGNDPQFKCFICANEYMLLPSLRRHYKRKHEQSEYEAVCEHCNIYCETLQGLAEHRIDWHPELQCTICKRNFNTAKGMETHIAMHKNIQRPFECEICNASYDTKVKLSFHHQRAHSFEKPYKCLACNKRFVEYRDVIKHWKTVHHRSSRNLICNICDESFTNMFKLYEHVAQHTGFKTWQPENTEPFPVSTEQNVTMNN